MNSPNRGAALPKRLGLFLGLFIVVGLVGIGAGFVNLARGWRCESWPTTPGVITASDMVEQSGDQNGTTYSAVIAYHYKVGGRNYNGTKLGFGEMSASASYAQRILNRYPVGANVPVYYSPGDPELAVLEPGIHGGTWVCFGIGTLFVLGGAMFWQFAIAAQRRNQGAGGLTLRPGGAQMQQPPALLGVFIIVMGSLVCFAEPADGVPKWVVPAVGGVFVMAGLFLLAQRLNNPLYGRVLGGAVVVVFLAIFHWVSFGPGERPGTVTTPFVQHSGVSVKTFFAVFTVLMDLALLACVGRWLAKRR